MDMGVRANASVPTRSAHGPREVRVLWRVGWRLTGVYHVLYVIPAKENIDR
jgi:hypothetical protein